MSEDSRKNMPWTGKSICKYNLGDGVYPLQNERRKLGGEENALILVSIKQDLG